MLPMHWGTCKNKLLLIQKEKKNNNKRVKFEIC